jgi:hypothetical protein
MASGEQIRYVGPTRARVEHGEVVVFHQVVRGGRVEAFRGGDPADRLRLKPDEVERIDVPKT